MNNKGREIIYIAVAILLSILAIQLVIWLFPIILIAILAGYLYHLIKKKAYKYENNQATKKRENEQTKKKKKTVIIDGEYSEK